MNFRSSPVLLLLFATALLGGVFFWNMMPRLWGGEYQGTEQELTPAMDTVFLLADGAPANITVAKLNEFTIENRLPHAMTVGFVRAEDERTVERIEWKIGTSSTALVRFATSGVWRCESTIIRMCGTVHVTE